jgi:HSP20 family protein
MKGMLMNTEANEVATATGRARNPVPAVEKFVPPGVDIFETGDGYTLVAEMPGVKKEGLEVTVEGNELTLIGRREKDGTAGEPLHRESVNADYRRVFELNPAIAAKGIDARLEQGLLTIRLPKSERVKPRKVVVAD